MASESTRTEKDEPISSPEPQPYLEETLMLCQDCEATALYSGARHSGEQRCHCGGEFCCCPACMEAAADIVLGQLVRDIEPF